MREKDLPFDRTKHVCYTKNAKKCVQKLHATLIRKGMCCTGACCDYYIVGDQNPLAAEYELKAVGNGLLVSVRKER